jgi:hypothetical protein
MSTQTAAAVQKDWATYYPYLAKRQRIQGAPIASLRSFSKWDAAARLTVVALSAAAVFGTHAADCYRYWPVNLALLLFCLLYSSGTNKTLTESRSKKLSFFFKHPDQWQLFCQRANLGDYECQAPVTLIRAPFYVKRLRLVHDLDEDREKNDQWRFDDPDFVAGCRFVWEVFGVQEPASTEPDREGFRFVDFTSKRA